MLARPLLFALITPLLARTALCQPNDSAFHRFAGVDDHVDRVQPGSRERDGVPDLRGPTSSGVLSQRFACFVAEARFTGQRFRAPDILREKTAAIARENPIQYTPFHR